MYQKGPKIYICTHTYTHTHTHTHIYIYIYIYIYIFIYANYKALVAKLIRREFIRVKQIPQEISFIII